MINANFPEHKSQCFLRPVSQINDCETPKVPKVMSSKLIATGESRDGLKRRKKNQVEKEKYLNNQYLFVATIAYCFAHTRLIALPFDKDTR